MITDICSDFSVSTRAGFTGSTGRVSGATFMMVNSKAIKCTKEAFEGGAPETSFTSFAVINVHSEGMVRAPFKYNDKKQATKTPSKPLTALDAAGAMQFWTYQRKGTDKGDRFDDVTWALRPGTTLKWFFRADDVDKSLPAGVEEIPAFSLCEVSMIPKSSDPCVEGWGLNIRSVRVSSLSLYSYLKHLQVFPSSREESKIAMLEEADKQQPIRRQIDSDNPCFMPTLVSPAAYTEYVEEHETVKIWNYRNDNPALAIDIDAALALKYTNTDSVEDAMRLMEVAIVAGAFKVFVCTSEFRGRKPRMSECFGVPLIDTEKLFACVCPDKHVEGVGDPAFTLMENVRQFSKDAETLCLRICSKHTTDDIAAQNATADLVLTSKGDACKKAYPVEFFLAESGTTIWAGYFNVSPVEMACGAVTMCPQRRKWDSR